MGENSKIEWTDHTFNPWVGCTKVSPACDNCYAENWAKRTGSPELWAGERRRTAVSNWRKPRAWNDDAGYRGVRARVFCASLADVFDNQVPSAWRKDLFDLIAGTQYLDWLLLTKRPQNIAKMLPEAWGDGWPNVWLGTTVENREEAKRRVPLLLSVPAAVRFLSCEPLLEPVMPFLKVRGEVVDWIICGGESGAHAREMNPRWARDLRDGCHLAGVAFFMKQMTKKEPIPDDLMVREFPR